MNAWFSIINDMTGNRMYCFGEDDSIINPTLYEKQLAMTVLRPYISAYCRGSRMNYTIPKYDNSITTMSKLTRRIDLKGTCFV